MPFAASTEGGTLSSTSGSPNKKLGRARAEVVLGEPAARAVLAGGEDAYGLWKLLGVEYGLSKRDRDVPSMVVGPRGDVAD